MSERAPSTKARRPSPAEFAGPRPGSPNAGPGLDNPDMLPLHLLEHELPATAPDTEPVVPEATAVPTPEAPEAPIKRWDGPLYKMFQPGEFDIWREDDHTDTTPRNVPVPKPRAAESAPSSAPNSQPSWSTEAQSASGPERTDPVSRFARTLNRVAVSLDQKAAAAEEKRAERAANKIAMANLEKANRVRRAQNRETLRQDAREKARKALNSAGNAALTIFGGTLLVKDAMKGLSQKVGVEGAEVAKRTRMRAERLAQKNAELARRLGRQGVNLVNQAGASTRTGVETALKKLNKKERK